jgi:hypothetical protein
VKTAKTRTLPVTKDPTISCPCVTVHRPALVELHFHHIIPLYAGGKDSPSNKIGVCPSTHYAVHALTREYEKAGGKPSWDIRRQFPEFARELAQRGWDGRTAQARKMKQPKD